MQCFAKGDFWASCRATCTPGDWTCKKLGKRSESKVSCTWSGQDCGYTKLCCNPKEKCVKKDEQQAFCTRTPDPAWDGTVIGGARGEYEVQPAGPGNELGNTLYCFMAVLPGSPEEQLQHVAQQNQAGIYGCDAHAIFSSEHCQFVRKNTWNSFVNTDVFMKIWEKVKADGKFKHYDWTVKADPDSVFHADRLRSHIASLHPPAGKPIYLKNVQMGFGFLGAIEIISKIALINYLDNIEDCHSSIGSFSGEDGFIKGCLDMVGAGYMADASILTNPGDTSGCTDGSRVCFHPRKDTGSWQACWNNMNR